MVSTAVRTFARGIPWNLFLLTLGCGLFALGVKAVAIPHMLISGYRGAEEMRMTVWRHPVG